MKQTHMMPRRYCSRFGSFQKVCHFGLQILKMEASHLLGGGAGSKMLLASPIVALSSLGGLRCWQYSFSIKFNILLNSFLI